MAELDPPSDCPSDADLVALTEGRMAKSAARALHEHVKTCSACGAIYPLLVADPSPPVSPEDQLALGLLSDGSQLRTQPAAPARQLDRGGAVGRYLVVSLLGRGSMGEVYAAYDPDLDRRVAVKLLHVNRADPGAQERLLREARALGRLSHPNVVQIHDVGEHQGDVFLAMELIEGDTLETFCQTSPPPSWRSVVAAYLDAARGLAAAHAQGLVHRDIKPSNILRGKDGRVRVADFGLVSDPSAETRAPSVGGDQPQEVATRLETARVSLGARGRRSGEHTSEGSLVGTPLYMAPEQHRSPQVSAASDQFSLCASLYEGLFRRQPFRPSPGTDLHTDLLTRKMAGVGPAPSGSKVPSWVYRALSRGLSPRAEDRYPSLTDLIRALSDDPATRRLRVGLAAAAALALPLAAAGWLHGGTVHDPCAHPETELAGAWDATVSQRLREAFAGSARPYAKDSAERVIGLLDPYAASWATMRREVCSFEQQHPQRRDVADLRDACLDRRLGSLRALTAVLVAHPGPATVDRAVGASAALPSVADCAEVESLRARTQPPEGAAPGAQVTALQPRVDRLGALFAAGQFPQVLSEGELLLPEVGKLPPELDAQVRWWMGRADEQTGDFDAATSFLHDAARQAAAAHDSALEAEVWSQLLLVAGDRQKKLGEAAVVRTLGPTLLAQANDDRARWMWLSAESATLVALGQFAEASRAQQEAVSVSERLWGLSHPAVADSLNDLGVVFQRQGDYPAAIAAHQRALAIREQALGPTHLSVAESLNNLAAVWMASGDYVSGVAAARRSLQLVEGIPGIEPRPLAVALGGLGDALTLSGQSAEAIPLLERSVLQMEKAAGPDSWDVAGPLTALGRAQLIEGHVPLALSLLRRADLLMEKASGATNPDRGAVLAELGRAEVRAGELSDAGQSLQRALDLRAPLHESDDGATNTALLGRAELALAQGRPSSAVPDLEGLLHSRQRSISQEARLTLAEALWEVGADRPRARALAEEARTEFDQVHHQPGLERATRWLAEHRLDS